MNKKSLYSLELFIAKFLRYGVLLAGVLLFLGWMSQFQYIGNPLEKFSVYEPVPFLESFQQYWSEGRWGLVIAYCGLCLLVSLPLLRVLMTAGLFFRQKEYLMSGAAALVFLALLVSFSLGMHL